MAHAKTPDSSWPDAQLVQRCLDGDEWAWHALVDKYKNLTYSLILKYRTGPDEATDLFQAVWLDAFNDLPKLKKPGSFKPWLISLTNHKCYQWRQKQNRRSEHELQVEEKEQLENQATVEAGFADELEQQQLVRDVLRQLPERCQKLLHLLFFAKPPKPYEEVAKELGLATGSIGFIRGRCLDKMKKLFAQHGL